MESIWIVLAAVLMGAVLIFSVIALIVLLVIYQKKRMDAFWKAHHAAWTQIAQSLGITYKPVAGGYGMIEGPHEGVWVRIDTYTVNNDNSSQTYTRVCSFHHPPLGLGLKVSREGFMSSLGKMVGVTRDIETGDAQFDKTFVIEGHNRDTILQILNPDVRTQLMRYAAIMGAADLTDQAISGTLTGRATHVSQLQRLVMAQVALILAVRRAYTQVQSDALQPEFAHASISGSR